MKATYKQAMQWIALSEGGYVNHPKDPGGATNKGITQAVYSAYLRRRGHPNKAVVDISDDEVADIYQAQYAHAIRYSQLPSGLDYALLDFAVNSGVSRAVKTLQKIVGVNDDGIIGDLTLSAIADCDTHRLITDLCQHRLRFLRCLKTFRFFGKGWTKRVMGREKGVQNGDIGVVDRAILLASGAKAIEQPITVTPRSVDTPFRITALMKKAIKNRATWGAITAQVGTILTAIENNHLLQLGLVICAVLITFALAVAFIRGQNVFTI